MLYRLKGKNIGQKKRKARKHFSRVHCKILFLQCTLFNLPPLTRQYSVR